MIIIIIVIIIIIIIIVDPSIFLKNFKACFNAISLSRELINTCS